MLNDEHDVNANVNANINININNDIDITEPPTSLSSTNYIHNETHNDNITISKDSPQTPSTPHPLNNSTSNIASTLSLSKQHTIPLQQQRYRCKRIRRTLLLLSDKNGNALFSIGPDWGFFVFLMLLMTVFMLLIVVFAWWKLSFFFKLLISISATLFYVTYTYTVFINPGYPENTVGKFTGVPNVKYRFCSICRFYVRKDILVTHCSDCGMCIENYDHHCPWMTKCVGKNNYVSFKLFLFTVICVFALFISAVIKVK